MIDNIATHDTPEGIELTLTPAGLVPRAGAWLIDWLVRAVVVSVIAMVLAGFGRSGMGLIFIVYFLVNWFYAVYFEVARGGQTIGKKSYDIMVVMDSGMPVGIQASLIRNLLKVADFLPMGYFVGVVASLANTQNKRLGDIAAGTMVVHVPKIKADYHIKTATAYPAPMPLTVKEQGAILSFVERMDELPNERQEELLAILVDFLQSQGNNQKHGTAKILGIANSIVGNSDATEHSSVKGYKG